jgi:hypothetical protein
VLEIVFLERKVFQKQESLNLLSDLVTKSGSLYTKQRCYCIQIWGEKPLLSDRAFRIFT